MNNSRAGRLLLVSLPGPNPSDVPLFPLGIGYLAAMLQQDRPVHTVHYHRFEDVQQQLPGLLLSWQPAVVGITCTTFNRGAVKRVCEWLRAAHPEIRLVVGGVHVSYLPEQALRNYGADCVVIGEGELSLRELCNAFDAGNPLHDIHGIAFLENGGLIVTPRREPVRNLDDLPIPDYSFAGDLMRTTGMGFLITSRGCPVQCHFCSTSSYWGQQVRTNSPRRVVDEMELLAAQYGVRKVFFHDDTFNLGLKRVREICEEIRARGLDLEWGVSCRVHPVSEEMIDLMVDSGCRHICWGIESGSETILAGIDKKITLQQIRCAFELCRKHLGVLTVGAFTMVGNPGETEETIAQSIAFLNTLPMTDPPSTSMLYILPGTSLYQRVSSLLPRLDSFWVESDDVPYYTLEHPLERLQTWCEKVSRSGDRVSFDRSRHFWNHILFHHEQQSGCSVNSELDQVIPPEIKDDEFYELIRQLAQQAAVKTILEIGSSAGGGSTEAFVTGIRNRADAPGLFCMEVSRPRFMQLKDRYRDDSFVHCYNVSSVPVSCFPPEREVELFYRFVPTALNQFPLEQVIGWLRQDIDYIRQHNVPENGIRLIKEENTIETFDMVLIDGSEFLGRAELDEVYGAGIILLDDVDGFKNYHNRQRLLADPAYHLYRENLQLRNGYSVFMRNSKESLPVHFFTIVLNGEPFIRHHIDVFRELPFPWHWHIVEGVADLVQDTAWSLPNGGRITDDLHHNGLSNDGTSQYLDELRARFPDLITVYRKPNGLFWNGKLEMVNAPLPNIKEHSLLWQVDSDELWSREQILRLHRMFDAQPDKTAAWFICNFYVGPGLAVSSVDTYGNHTHYEWYRCWRYEPGDRWLSHEPPRLGRALDDQTDLTDVGSINPFTHLETAEAGLIFDHFAYVSAKQSAFKQIYYGYPEAVEGWLRLQHAATFPVLLRDYFPWVHDDATVTQSPLVTTARAHIIYLRVDAIGDSVLSAGMLPYLRQRYPGALLTVVCQDRVAPLYEASPFVDGVISFNFPRFMTQNGYRQLISDKINRLRPTLVLNPTYSHDLHDEFLAHHCQAPLKIACQGDASNREQVKIDAMQHLYSLVVPNKPGDLTELDRHATFLQGIGIAAPAVGPKIWLTESDDAWATDFLGLHGIAAGEAIALFPGALLDCKAYPHYADVVSHLSDYPLILLGGNEVDEKGELLCAAHGGQSANLAGKTSLRQMAALMKRCRIYLGSDSAGLHIACAVGLRNVVLLGGGHFGRFCPYSYLTTAVALPLSCYHCNWGCRYERPHCLHDISPQVVLKACRAALTETEIPDRPTVYLQQTSCFSDTPPLLPLEALMDRSVLVPSRLIPERP